MKNSNIQPDESLLIDYLSGNCDESLRDEITRRLEADAQFKSKHDSLAKIFSTLDYCAGYGAPEDLVDRTMRKIEAFHRTEELIAREETQGRGFRPMFSLRELGTMAAAAILLAVVFIPWVKQARMQAYQRQCAANLGQVGTAISGFAADNNGRLPSKYGNNVWLPQNGTPVYSNSHNMFKLVQGHYAPVQIFICPADKDASTSILRISPQMQDFPSGVFISYSYQHPAPASRSITSLVPSANRMVIVSDKTPLFDSDRFLPERINSKSSENHNRTGHNALFFDRHVEWRDSPNIGVDDDNIYQIEGVTNYSGVEAPSKPTDTFLLPAWTKSK